MPETAAAAADTIHLCAKCQRHISFAADNIISSSALFSGKPNSRQQLAARIELDKNHYENRVVQFHDRSEACRKTQMKTKSSI